MIDPEIDYQRLASGNPGSITGAADTLADVGHDLDDTRGRIHDAAETTDWTGATAAGFEARITQLADGISINRTTVARARGALDTAASAYQAAIQNADHYIRFWRNRPGGLVEVLEQILAMIIRARLVEVATTYSQQLTGIAGVLDGEDVDLDKLDEDTRAWVEQGLAKNQEWAAESGSTFGPLIPNTAAAGDDRGLIPQGLAYDPRTSTYLMTHYPAGADDRPATLALVDSVTGEEIGDVTLGGSTSAATPFVPTHAGGVSVQGDDVYVVDKGRVYTYSMSDIRSQRAGATVNATSVQDVPGGGSYSAVHNGVLYLGDFETSKLHVYERDTFGGWQPMRDTSGQAIVHDTPDQSQGLVVRDGEFVFSISPNRFDESTLIAQDRDTGERSDPYTLPNMAEGVVEVDGNLVTTYESTARKFDDDGRTHGWLPFRADDDDLWPNPYLTQTPLSALGLTGDFDVQPGTLRQAANALDHPASQLSSVSSTIGDVRVRAHDLGEVPGAIRLANALTTLLDAAAASLRSGSKAIALAADNLIDTARDYHHTDEVVGSAFRVTLP